MSLWKAAALADRPAVGGAGRDSQRGEGTTTTTTTLEAAWARSSSTRPPGLSHPGGGVSLQALSSLVVVTCRSDSRWVSCYCWSIGYRTLLVSVHPAYIYIPTYLPTYPPRRRTAWHPGLQALGWAGSCDWEGGERVQHLQRWLSIQGVERRYHPFTPHNPLTPTALTPPVIGTAYPPDILTSHKYYHDIYLHHPKGQPEYIPKRDPGSWILRFLLESNKSHEIQLMDQE